MHKFKIAIIASLAWVNTSILLAKNAEVENINHVELASIMLKDGHLDRAKLALSQVDLTDENIDIQRYYVISALYNIRLNNNLQAIESIQKAKELGAVDPIINVYLAQAAYAEENFKLTIQALEAAGNTVAKIPSIYHMRAQSYWNLNKHDWSLAVLNQASEIFPEDKSFPRRAIFYYLELGYNKQAVTLGKAYLKKHTGELNDYIAIGNAIRASGDLVSALQFLEESHLKFPTNENISKSLAAVYIGQGNLSAAAQIIHQAALLNPDLMKEAAELYRRSGAVYMALSLNGLIVDQTEKVKQRLALFLQLENFEAAAGMEDNIKRIQLDQEDDIKYALAYAQFKIGKYIQSENYLSQITSTDNLNKAIELRKIMQDCQQEKWRCQ